MLPLLASKTDRSAVRFALALIWASVIVVSLLAVTTSLGLFYVTDTGLSARTALEAPPFRVAIVISGTFRTFDLVADSLRQHVFEALRRRQIHVEVFVYMTVEPNGERDLAATEAYLRDFQRRSDGAVVAVRAIDDRDDQVADLPVAFLYVLRGVDDNYRGVLQQMNGWKKGFAMVQERERSVRRTVDMVVRMRSDMLWVKDVPDPRTFPTDVPTLPTNYIYNPAILQGCMDDKILWLPRRLAPAWFGMLDRYVRNNGTRFWYGFYQFLTDGMLEAAGLPVDRYGATSMDADFCGDGVLAPFHYVELAAITWRRSNCFESFCRDNWSGYSDICPKPHAENTTAAWTLPPGSNFCYYRPGQDQTCPPEFLDEGHFNVDAVPRQSSL